MATNDPVAGSARGKGKGDAAAAGVPGGDEIAAPGVTEIPGGDQHRAAGRPPRASRAVPGKGSSVPGVRLRDVALAGLGWASRDALTAANRAPEAGYLLEQVKSAGAGAEWVAALTALLARPAPADQILVALARDLKLQPIEVIAVALAAAVEDDMMVGRALAYLQAPVGGSRPTMGLLHSAFAALAPAGTLAIDVISNGAAVRSGLLTMSGDAPPRPERTLAVPLPLCMALSGVESSWPGTTLIDPREACPLPRSVIEAANKHAGRLNSGVSQVLALRGGSLAERRAIAAAVAATAGRRPVVLADEKGGAAAGFAIAGFGVWARLCQLLPVLSWELAPGEVRTVPQFAGYEGPLIALNGPDGNVTNDAGTVLTWTLVAPQREEREALWRTALGDADLAADLARVHRHRAGRIAHLANLARQGAALDKRDAITRADLASAAWITEGVALDALAQPLATPVPDAALVVTPQLRADLNDLFARCNARDALAADLGPSIAARYHPGVKALFCGPSGSGKTLTAGWLATRLGIPLYRVDLASMTSKYIGETEKNLAQLLARAEEGEVMLLFDEADSLFGKRTEVKESNDRFANAQTNYLLQRIESFDGIALLTSNSRSRFDAAFMRRLDVVIDFPLPGPEERRALWLSHLGSAHGLTQQELNQISASADLAGGHIRNAVVSAAVRAAGRAITFNDVAHGIAAEYRKLGKQTPSSLMAVSRQSP